jgi:ABC-type molybdate transport system substrate-binding protein
MKPRALGFAVALVATAAWSQQQPVHLYAAGSLRAAMTEIVRAFTASGEPAVEATFGPSGLLRERIENGAPADVFASADMANPEALARAGRAAPPVIFARNRLCALVAPGVDVNSDTLLDRMLDPSIKLGTSTPKADPSGDYAWQLFAKADQLRPGAFKALDGKALKLTGGANSPAPPPERSIYALMIAEHRADIFLTYCTNAMQAVHQVPGAQSVQIPAALAVGAEYGLTMLNDAGPGAKRLAGFIVSPTAQEILERYGFAVGGTP